MSVSDLLATNATTPPQMSEYNQFFKGVQPSILAANPTWTPQQVTTEIGRRWSLQKMEIKALNDVICVSYAKHKYTIDACGKHSELKTYLDAYRVKHGHEALLKLVEKLV